MPLLAQELIPPQEILSLARKSQVDFLRAVGKLEQAAPYITNKQQVVDYLLILDDLERIGIQLDVDELGEIPWALP